MPGVAAAANIHSMETKSSAAAIIGPSQDPFEDVPYTNPSFFFPENPTLGPTVQNTLIDYPDFIPGHDLSNILDPEDPLSDPLIWSFCNEIDDHAIQTSGPEAGAGSSEVSSHVANQFFNSSDNSVFVDNTVQIPSYNCSSCLRLRVISHTNGMCVKRLEIHGGLGVIAHAIVEIYSFDSSLNNQDITMFDFQKESLETVKTFLIQYFEDCKQEGYTTLQDPLLSFYQALSVGLNDPDNPNDYLLLSPENTGGCSNIQQQDPLGRMEGGSNQGGDFSKIPLALQRERTRNLKLKDLKDFFNLPIEDAARKLNVCPTVMKKICRRNGMLRWPYRKIKSLERKIANNVQMLDASRGEERAHILETIERHQKELASIYETFTE